MSSYRQVLTERKRAELQDRVHKAVQEAEGGCANRDVTPVWKLSIADANDLHSSCGEPFISCSDASDYRWQKK